MAIRTNLNGFIAAVGARSTSVNQYVATTLPTNPSIVKITKNGVVLWPAVYWQGPNGGTATDANPSADEVTIFSSDNLQTAISDAQQFLNTLT